MKRFKYLIAILLFSFSLVVNAEVVTYERTKEEAREYISKNIDEYKLFITSDWALSNGYF